VISRTSKTRRASSSGPHFPNQLCPILTWTTTITRRQRPIQSGRPITRASSRIIRRVCTVLRITHQCRHMMHTPSIPHLSMVTATLKTVLTMLRIMTNPITRVRRTLPTQPHPLDEPTFAHNYHTRIRIKDRSREMDTHRFNHEMRMIWERWGVWAGRIRMRARIHEQSRIIHIRPRRRILTTNNNSDNSMEGMQRVRRWIRDSTQLRMLPRRNGRHLLLVCILREDILITKREVRVVVQAVVPEGDIQAKRFNASFPPLISALMSFCICHDTILRLVSCYSPSLMSILPIVCHIVRSSLPVYCFFFLDLFFCFFSSFFGGHSRAFWSLPSMFQEFIQLNLQSPKMVVIGVSLHAGR